MYRRNQLVTRFMIAAFVALTATAGACGGGQTPNRFYDPYYGDYHRWNRTELDFYGRWEGETGRSHVDFGRRPVEEQQAYLNWRHQH